MHIPLTSVKGIESGLEFSHFSTSMQNTESVQQEELNKRRQKEPCGVLPSDPPRASLCEVPGGIYKTRTDVLLSEFINEQIEKS